MNERLDISNIFDAAIERSRDEKARLEAQAHERQVTLAVQEAAHELVKQEGRSVLGEAGLEFVKRATRYNIPLDRFEWSEWRRRMYLVRPLKRSLDCWIVKRMYVEPYDGTTSNYSPGLYVLPDGRVFSDSVLRDSWKTGEPIDPMQYEILGNQEFDPGKVIVAMAGFFVDQERKLPVV